MAKNNSALQQQKTQQQKNNNNRLLYIAMTQPVKIQTMVTTGSALHEKKE